MTSVATPFSLQAHRLFDGDFVKGVHAHLDVGDIDARVVRLHPDLDVVVDHAFDGDQDFHGIPLQIVMQEMIDVYVNVTLYDGTRQKTNDRAFYYSQGCGAV